MFAEHPEKICPAFQKQESIIKDILNIINKVDGLSEKVRFTKKLLKEVNVLLSCPDYDGKKSDCSNCHFIEKLRKKTAEIIIKAEKLT